MTDNLGRNLSATRSQKGLKMPANPLNSQDVGELSLSFNLLEQQVACAEGLANVARRLSNAIAPLPQEPPALGGPAAKSDPSPPAEGLLYRASCLLENLSSALTEAGVHLDRVNKFLL